jgi:spermidine synthase
MLLADPDKLELGYVRAMTSWLLFKSAWREALVIGLGGGSLVKFLLHQFPDGHLRVVEYRESVVKIARSHFGLPLDPRLKILVGDGNAYVRQRIRTRQEQYCVLLVDAFDHDGMAESIANEAFFEGCQLLLNADGMLVINLWGGTQNPLFQQIALWMGRVFDWRVLFLPVRNRGNIVALAFNQSLPVVLWNELKTRAVRLEERYQIEFNVFLHDFCRHNGNTIKQIISR